MDTIARLPVGDRRALFTETAARAGITSIIAEKDFWVCWTLSRLYTIEGMPRLLFKGGTSLSKCFRLIERFSEDLDLGLHRDDIGLSGDRTPSPDKGSSSQKKARKHLRVGTQEYVAARFVPMVRGDFEEALAEPFDLRLATEDADSVVDFHYPRTLAGSAYGIGSYVAPSVRMEIGARSDHYPTEHVEVMSYASTHFPGAFAKAACRVVAQAPERTLLEKALILHTDIARGKVTRRSSRHAYDLVMMRRAGTMMKVTRELFEQVALHKRVFSDDRHAGLAPERGIRMVPAGELQRELESDYRSMNEMFFREPPAFEDIIGELHALESAINDLPRRTAG